MKIRTVDWEYAELKLDQLSEEHTDLLAKMRVNPIFRLSVINSLKERLDRGERTEELYAEIQDAQ